MNCDFCNKKLEKYKKRGKNIFCNFECRGKFQQNETIKKILSKKFFGELEVICQNGFHKSPSKQSKNGFILRLKFDCKCNRCGTIISVVSDALLRGHTTKCKNCANRKYGGEFSIHLSRLDGNLIRGKSGRILENEIDNEILHELYYNILNGICYWSKKSIRIAKTIYDLMDFDILSIDRINPNIGYIKNNIVLCRKEYNIMRKELSIEKFIYHCEKIANFNGVFPKFNRIIKENRHFNFKGHKEVSGRYVSDLKNKAFDDKRDWKITSKDIWEKYIIQGGVSALGYGEVFFCPFSPDSKNYFEQTASVDRIDSSKGYTVDNIQIVHKTENRMKQDLEQSHFIDLCKSVSINHGIR